MFLFLLTSLNTRYFTYCLKIILVIFVCCSFIVSSSPEFLCFCSLVVTGNNSSFYRGTNLDLLFDVDFTIFVSFDPVLSSPLDPEISANSLFYEDFAHRNISFVKRGPILHIIFVPISYFHYPEDILCSWDNISKSPFARSMDILRLDREVFLFHQVRFSQPELLDIHFDEFKSTELGYLPFSDKSFEYRIRMLLAFRNTVLTELTK